MISLKGVSKSYKGITIFEDVNITFMPNKWNFIEGVNGSGKSVLLKLICGFSKPDTGIVTVDDYVIGQDFDFIQNAGICINSPDFFNNLSGMDNLLEIAKIKKIVTKTEIYQFCKLFGLEEDINKKYKYYSLGMKQKLRIIQAIMESPNILILDEPFDALDKQAKQIMQNYLNDFIKKDTFNKLGYKAKINTHTTSCINLFLDIYLYSEYRLIYC